MIKGKHNYKLSDDDKHNIVLSYYLNRSKDNLNKLCNEYDISRRTIYYLVKDEESKKFIEQRITESKTNFTKRIDLIIDNALNKIDEKLESGDIDKTTLKDLSIMIGTLYDKARLENNLSTENKAIEINIRVEK